METKNINLPDQGIIAWELFNIMYQKKEMKLSDEIYPLLEKIFNLTPEQKSLKYESGENIWRARVRAAKHNVFTKNNLFDSKEEGIWKITEKGEEMYKELARLGLKKLD